MGFLSAVASVASIGASIFGAKKAGDAASQAADIQAGSASEAIRAQREILDVIRGDFETSRVIGEQADFALADMLGVPRPLEPTQIPGTTGTSAALNSSEERELNSLVNFLGTPEAALARITGQIQAGGNQPEDENTLIRQKTLLERFLDGAGLESEIKQQPTSALLTADRAPAFLESPDYQFRLSEGIKATERSAAARGGLLSGRTLKALERFGQGEASQEFDRRFNRLGVLAGRGQAGTQGTSQAAYNTGQGVSNALLDQGAARASGVVGRANATTSGIEGIASVLGNISGGGLFN